MKVTVTHTYVYQSTKANVSLMRCEAHGRVEYRLSLADEVRGTTRQELEALLEVTSAALEEAPKEAPTSTTGSSMVPSARAAEADVLTTTVDVHR